MKTRVLIYSSKWIAAKAFSASDNELLVLISGSVKRILLYITGSFAYDWQSCNYQDHIWLRIFTICNNIGCCWSTNFNVRLHYRLTFLSNFLFHIAPDFDHFIGSPFIDTAFGFSERSALNFSMPVRKTFPSFSSRDICEKPNGNPNLTTFYPFPKKKLKKILEHFKLTTFWPILQLNRFCPYSNSTAI